MTMATKRKELKNLLNGEVVGDMKSAMSRIMARALTSSSSSSSSSSLRIKGKGREGEKKELLASPPPPLPSHYEPLFNYSSRTEKDRFDVDDDNDDDKSSSTASMVITGKAGSPIPPLVQLLAILPPASGHALPTPLRALQDVGTFSDLHGNQFYPSLGKLTNLTDVMGEPERPWLWVVRLPFLPLYGLCKAVDELECLFTAKEKARNMAVLSPFVIRFPLRKKLLLAEVNDDDDDDDDEEEEDKKEEEEEEEAVGGGKWWKVLFSRRGLLLQGGAVVIAAVAAAALKITPAAAAAAAAAAAKKALAVGGLAGVVGVVGIRSLILGLFGTKTPSEKAASLPPGWHEVAIAEAGKEGWPLQQQLREQIEFYFGDSNFSRDRFLQSKQVATTSSIIDRKLVNMGDDAKNIGTVGVDHGEKEGGQGSTAVKENKTTTRMETDPVNPHIGTGWIPIAEIMQFNRLRIILAQVPERENRDLVSASIRESSVVIASECKNYLRRRVAV
eukprot:jgi/Bigna1/90835/estExt_fgenesh1_pg.C_800106